MKTKPKITATRIISRSRIFNIEQVDLVFSNGQQACYERISNNSAGAVLVVPILDDHLVLIREYCCGVDRYELGFVKGLVEENESIIDGANRELMEEAGFAAQKLDHIKTVSTSPGYMQSQVHIVIAQNLYKKKLVGDEPEPLEVVLWNLSEIDQLIERDDFTDARGLAALYLLRSRQWRTEE